MANMVVVGSQWGDEGKAKAIDYLTERSDIVIRYQGGANAGHTVIVKGEKFVFHLVPSGIIYPEKTCVVGNGVVLDPEQFLREIDELKAKNIDTAGRVFVSEQAHLVLPCHRDLDKASETQMASGKIGTTGRGIGPTYADKASRSGIRVGELLDWDRFVERLSEHYGHKEKVINQLLNGSLSATTEEVIERYREIREKMLPFIRDTAAYLFSASREGKRLLFEGAQGTFLDIDHGTYPFVTSSNTISGAACPGAGVGPGLIDHVIGIVKAYTTRVGNGPFPTELHDDVGERLRAEGGEFGATTGRPRRCGWFDSVALRKAVQVNGLTRIALTKLDVLNVLDEIKVCTHYELDGKRIDQFPTSTAVLDRVVPIYETLPGWKSDLSQCKSMDELPENAIRYVKRLQELCYDVPLLIISIGPERSQTIEVQGV
jgi:adenylosuccinate synthase